MLVGGILLYLWREPRGAATAGVTATEQVPSLAHDGLGRKAHPAATRASTSNSPCTAVIRASDRCRARYARRALDQ